MEAKNRGIRIKVMGIGIAIDREQTTAVYDDEGKVVLNQKGENAIGSFVSKTQVPVHSVAGIREVVEYLYAEKIPVTIEGRRAPLDDKTKHLFDDYLKTYGVH
jgi:hypothetical protein